MVTYRAQTGNARQDYQDLRRVSSETQLIGSDTNSAGKTARFLSGAAAAQTIANMCNASLTQGILPASQKHALVKPRLRKQNLDQENLNSYRPISNLSFISKTIERVVAVRFQGHCEALSLLPVCQSAYGAYNSTETAVAIAHNVDAVHK